MIFEFRGGILSNKDIDEDFIMLNQQHSTNCKPTNQIVAYFDILGTKDLIDANSDELFEALKKTYNLWESTLKIAGEQLGKTYGFDYKPQIFFFSDNVVISQRFSEKDFLHVLNDVLSFSTMFQLYLLEECHLFTRGGICCGKFYSDDVFVYGEALVKAYSLESANAIYPRVLIDSCLSKMVETDGSAQNEKAFFEQKTMLDFDGCRVLNYLHLVKTNDLPLLKDIIKNNIYKEQAGKNRPRVLQKLNWSLNFHETYETRRRINGLVNPSTFMRQTKKHEDTFGASDGLLDSKIDIGIAPNDEKVSSRNSVRLAGRNGSRIEKFLNDSQTENLNKIINELPDAPDDL